MDWATHLPVYLHRPVGNILSGPLRRSPRDPAAASPACGSESRLVSTWKLPACSERTEHTPASGKRKLWRCTSTSPGPKGQGAKGGPASSSDSLLQPACFHSPQGDSTFPICSNVSSLPAGFFHPLFISPSQVTHPLGSCRTQHVLSDLPPCSGFERLLLVLRLLLLSISELQRQKGLTGSAWLFTYVEEAKAVAGPWIGRAGPSAVPLGTAHFFRF